MALGVGTFSDGFGVAFTLLDQFSAIARKIETSMASLTASTQAMVSKTNSALAGSTIGGFSSIREKSAHMKTMAADAAALAESQRIAMATNAAMINVQSQLEQQAVAVAARDAMLMNGKMRQQRLYNSLQREQMIIDRQVAEQAAAAAAAQTALNGSMMMGAALIGTAIVGLGILIKGAKMSMEFEKAELAIEGFVGSAERAHEVFMNIQADAAAHPMMGFQNMLKANNLLISQGKSAEFARQTIRDLSTLLAAVGRGAPELARISLDFEKIAAQGKVMGIDLRQMQRAGIPIREILAKYLGHALPATLEDTTVTIEDLAKALHNAVAPGTQFGKAFMKVSESLAYEAAAIKQTKLPQMFDAIGDSISGTSAVVVKSFGAIIDAIKVFSQSWVGQVFWNLIGAFSLLSAVVGVNLLRIMAVKWIFKAFAMSMGLAAGSITSFVGASGSMSAALILMGKRLMASPAFWWIAAITGGIMLASNAMQHFRRVMNGQEEAASGGWLSTLQKIGGILMFIGEAVKTYDSATRKSTFSQGFVTALDKLGLHDITAKLESWIGAIISFIDGFTSGISSFFSTLFTIFDTLTAPIRWILTFLGWLIPGIDGTNAAMEGWARTGKVLAWVLGTLLVGQLWKMGAAIVATIVKIIAAEAELMAFTIPIMTALWPAMLLIAGSAAIIAGNMDIMGGAFDSTSKKIDASTIAMQEYNKAMEEYYRIENERARFQYKKAHHLPVSRWETLKYNWDPIWGINTNEKPDSATYGIGNKGLMDFQLQQQQQAHIDTTRGQLYPGLSSVSDNNSKGGGMVNATLVVDGKVLANVLVPYLNDINRREQLTNNNSA